MPPPILNQADKVIKRKIINAADNIKKKYISLKLERNETDKVLNKFLTPIRTPLAKIAENTNNIINTEKIKNEFKEEEEDDNGDKKPLIHPQTSAFLPTKVVAESDADKLKYDSDDEVFMKNQNQDDESLHKSILEQTPSYREYLEQYPKLAREYIGIYYSEPIKIDHTYGLNHDEETDA